MKWTQENIIPAALFIAALFCIFSRNPIAYWSTFALSFFVSVINIYFDRKRAHIAIYVAGNAIFLILLVLYLY